MSARTFLKRGLRVERRCLTCLRQAIRRTSLHRGRTEVAHVGQTWGQEGNVISHVYNHSTEQSTIGNLYNACVTQLLIEENPSTVQQAQCDGAMFGQILKLHACRSDGTLDGDPP